MRTFENGDPEKGEVCIGIATADMFKASLWQEKRLDEKPFSGLLFPIPTGKPEEDTGPVTVEIRPGGRDQFLMYVSREEYLRRDPPTTAAP